MVGAGQVVQRPANLEEALELPSGWSKPSSRLMSLLRPGRQAGRAFGALSAAHSAGLVVANLALGLLYGLGPAWSYSYAASVAVIAAAVMLKSVPALRAAGN